MIAVVRRERIDGHRRPRTDAHQILHPTTVLSVSLGLQSRHRHSVEEYEMLPHSASLFESLHCTNSSMRCVCTLGRHDIVTPLGREVSARKSPKQSREAPGFPTRNPGGIDQWH